MYLPLLQSISKSDVYVSGDVKIHPNAAIASGASLQAAPNSRIVIGANVCIGVGVIINAYQGSIEIEDGVTIGSGVLIVGTGKIGSNACIGSKTTIFNTSVESMSVLAANTIIGDISRQISIEPQQSASEFDREELVDIWQEEETIIDNTLTPETESKATDPETKPEISERSPKTDPHTIAKPEHEINGNSSHHQPLENKSQNPTTVGQIYINQLLVTLFPHGRYFDNNGRKNAD